MEKESRASAWGRRVLSPTFLSRWGSGLLFLKTSKTYSELLHLTPSQSLHLDWELGAEGSWMSCSSTNSDGVSCINWTVQPLLWFLANSSLLLSSAKKQRLHASSFLLYYFSITGYHRKLLVLRAFLSLWNVNRSCPRFNIVFKEMINITKVLKTEWPLGWEVLGGDESYRQRLLIWSDQLGNHNSIK